MAYSTMRVQYSMMAFSCLNFEMEFVKEMVKGSYDVGNLLYFRHYHHKYALEAFHTLALVELVATPHIRQQFVWSRVVNNRGGAGNNIPVDLHK